MQLVLERTRDGIEESFWITGVTYLKVSKYVNLEVIYACGSNTPVTILADRVGFLNDNNVAVKYWKKDKADE